MLILLCFVYGLLGENQNIQPLKQYLLLVQVDRPYYSLSTKGPHRVSKPFF
ncbi:hypothetical protein I3760_12G076900 [Carya illinoinensis]|nr:hypothetical protein I3760_12G076900 [Carya illinoinensis]